VDIMDSPVHLIISYQLDSVARDTTLDHVVITFWSHDPHEFPKILDADVRSS
jgi:hypothetical protein